MFNKIPNRYLSICVTACGIFALSACTESNYNSEYVVDRKAEASAKGKETKLTEYIIVLKENVSVVDALNSLQKYDAQVIRDLKKSRYLIGLKNNPGINQLKNDLEGSEYIKHIQPNFSYKAQ